MYSFPLDQIEILNLCGSLQPLHDDEVDTIVNELKLKSLYIEDNPIISDEGISKLASGFTSLQELRVKSCVKLTDETLKALASYCPQLKLLDIRGCSLITDDGMMHLSNYQSTLAHLAISSTAVTNNSLAIIGNLSSLEYLDISNNDSITDDAFTHLVKLTKLSHLDVSSCDRISGAGIRILCEGKFPLCYLSLEKCSTLRDSILESIGGSPFSASLNEIILSGLNKITSVGIRSLARGCKMLQTVLLDGCENVNDKGMRVILSKFQSLL